MQQFDVAVIGAGIVGLCAALGFAQRELRVALIDAHNMHLNPPVMGRLYAINEASRQLFENLDVWHLINNQDISTYRAMHVWDASSKASIDFNAKDVAQNRLGDFIDEQVISHALLKKCLQTASMNCFPEHRVTKLEENPSSILIHCEGSQIETRGLVIADGAHSPCRKLLNIPQTEWAYHQQAIVAAISCEKSHQRTAWQVFEPHGTLALLPLHDEYTCSIVWSVQKDAAGRLLNSSVEDFNMYLTETSEHKLGCLKLINERKCFPLTMRHTKKYIGQRFVILGDAAHTIHPLAGLGLNLGLRDVRQWLHAIDKSKSIWPLKKHALAFERARQYDVWQHILCMQILKDLFLSRLPLATSLRSVGLQVCNRLPWLKRWLIAEALDRHVDEAF